jgi:uncharacterized protein YdaU (DUF1376 family)
MKDPAFLFYPNDWMGGTMGMTLEEKGAYMEVLMMQFNRGHMTEDMIVRMIGQLWLNVKHKFVVDEQGMWYNKRLDIEKEKRRSYTESRRNNREGTNQYSKKDGHMTSHMEDENENRDKKGGLGEEKSLQKKFQTMVFLPFSGWGYAKTIISPTVSSFNGRT